MPVGSCWATDGCISMNRPMRARGGVAPRMDRRERSGAAAQQDSAAAQLKGHAPLVPVQSAASRALVGVIAILTFLAALCAGAAELVASQSQERSEERRVGKECRSRWSPYH